MDKQRLKELAGMQLNEAEEVAFVVEINGEKVFGGKGQLESRDKDRNNLVVTSAGKQFILQLLPKIWVINTFTHPIYTYLN